jgi:hypothetical protein
MRWSDWRAQLVFLDGRVETRMFPTAHVDAIELPAYTPSRMYTRRFVYDRERSDREQIPTFCEVPES